MFNMITGFVTPNEGEITFDGVSVGHLKPHRIAQLGIVRSFQITNVFSGLTVRENLVTAHYLRARGSFRSEEHTSELQSLMRISYAVFCLKKKNQERNGRRYGHKQDNMYLIRT